MKQAEQTTKSKEMNSFLIEIQLSVNHSLFEKGYITEEMYTKAKELIIKS
ncbi:MAG: hypothetical protein RSE00_04350 [Clostridia bacterium]